MPLHGIIPPSSTTSYHGEPFYYVLFGIGGGILTVAVAVRLFTRWVLARKCVIEDFLILITWGLAAGDISLYVIALNNGIGQSNPNLATFALGLEWISVGGIVNCFTVMFVKLCILAQFLRVFAPNRHINSWMFFACWFLVVANIGVQTAMATISLWALIPLDVILGVNAGKNRIWSRMLFASSYFSAILDLSLLALPLPCIFKLNMKLRKKLALAAIFATGVLASAASMARLAYTYIASCRADVSYNTAALVVCGWYEICLAGLAFCMPTFPKFFHFIKAKIKPHSAGLRENEADDIDMAQMVLEHNASVNESRAHRIVTPDAISVLETTKRSGSHNSVVTESDREECRRTKVNGPYVIRLAV